jgi:hypothetical protein
LLFHLQQKESQKFFWCGLPRNFDLVYDDLKVLTHSNCICHRTADYSRPVSPLWQVIYGRTLLPFNHYGGNETERKKVFFVGGLYFYNYWLAQINYIIKN